MSDYKDSKKKIKNLSSEQATPEEEAAAERRLREMAEGKQKGSITMAKIIIVGIPVLLIAGILLAMAQLGGNRGRQLAENSQKNVESFVEDWYSQWDFVDGEYVECEVPDLTHYMIRNSDAQQDYQHRGSDAESVFHLSYTPNYQDCLYVANEDGTATVKISYYAATSDDMSEEDWEDLKAAGPDTVTYKITLDTSSRITEIELVDD